MSEDTFVFVIEEPQCEGENAFVLSDGQDFSDNVTEIVLEVNNEEQGSDILHEGVNYVYQVVDQWSTYQAQTEGCTDVEIDTASVVSHDAHPIFSPCEEDIAVQEHATIHHPRCTNSLPTADGKGTITVLSFDPDIKLDQRQRGYSSASKLDGESSPQFQTNNSATQDFYNQESKLSSNANRKAVKPDLWTAYDAFQFTSLKKYDPSQEKVLVNSESLVRHSDQQECNSIRSHPSTRIEVKDIVTEFGPHLEYKCLKCCKSFKKKLSLSIHELVHEDLGKQTLKINKAKFSCPVCRLTCVKRKYLRCHLKKEHNISGFFCCNLCKFVTLSSEEHSQHLQLRTHQEALDLWRDKSKQQPHPFLCTQCGYSTINKHRIENHVLSHVDQRDFVCPHCEYRGKSATVLKKHMAKHNPQERHTCLFCAYNTHDRYALLRHIRNMHGTREKKFKCRECGTAFGLMCELHIHSMLVHRSVHSFFCSQCDFSSVSKDEYRNHFSTHHSNGELYSCDTCHQVYRSMSSLKRHMRRHSRHRPYACPFCPQTFFEEGDKKRHMMIHKNDRPYSCSICRRKYKFRNALTVHMKVHSEVKGFKCDFCDYTTKYPGNLKKHLNVHKSIISNGYSCQLCPYQASRQNNLKQHIVKVHLKSI